MNKRLTLFLSLLVGCGLARARETEPRFFGTQPGALPEVKARRLVGNHSLQPALKGEAILRQSVFQYFPHSTAVPDWLPPVVSVHRGDWKLIRLFHHGEDGAHRCLLFNLREDLGGRNNLAAPKSELVAELDLLISEFHADRKATVPVPNPAFDPKLFLPEIEWKPKQKKAAGKRVDHATEEADNEIC